MDRKADVADAGLAFSLLCFGAVPVPDAFPEDLASLSGVPVAVGGDGGLPDVVVPTTAVFALWLPVPGSRITVAV